MESEKEKMLRIFFCIVFFLCLTSSYSQTVSDLRPTVTMKEYVDMKVEMLERMNDLRDDHHKEVSRIKDENVKLALASLDERLDGMNEFRKALEDSNSTFVTWQSLIWVIVGVSGFVFGYANYKKNQANGSGGGKNIVSGDKVEVKK